MNKYSEELKEKTREILYDCPVESFMRDLKCHLKNINGKFGTMRLRDAMESRYVIHLLNDTEGKSESYESIDDLLEGGWVVD